MPHPALSAHHAGGRSCSPGRLKGVSGFVRYSHAPATQGLVAVERCAGYAETIRPPGQFLAEFRRCSDNRTTDNIAVPIQILRR